MISIYIMTIEETLFMTDNGVLREMGNAKQHIAYRTLESLSEAYKMEFNKDLYDGEFDIDYLRWMLSSQKEFDEEHDGYFGFERVFKSVDWNEQVVYSVTVEDAILVD